jgi:hypothetical protein
MRRQPTPPVEIEIDQTYEQQVNGLGQVTGNVSDYAIEPRPEGTQPVAPAPRANYLPEQSTTAYEISAHEASALASAGQMAGQLLQVPYQPVNSADARQVDSAVTRDKASLLYSLAYAVPALLITIGLLFTVWLFRGGGFGGYFFAGLIVWGVAVMVILYHNRGQGLHHSPSGIAHHDIDARVEEAEIRADVAKHAIDAHINLLKYKWSLEDTQNGKRS